MRMQSIYALLAPGLALGLGLLGTAAVASPITVTFGTEVNQAFIDNYFNGGTDSQGLLTGPSDGLVFGANGESLRAGVSAASGGTGLFENLPSGAPGVLFYAPGNSNKAPAATVDVMNSTGFSDITFDYSVLNNSATFAGGTVQFWSDSNGTGTLLDTVTLTAAGTTVPCTANVKNGKSQDEFCTWSTVSATGMGDARSAVFTGNAVGFTEFDDLQISTVPLPGALLLLLSGVGGLAGAARRRGGEPA